MYYFFLFFGLFALDITINFVTLFCETGKKG